MRTLYIYVRPCTKQEESRGRIKHIYYKRAKKQPWETWYGANTQACIQDLCKYFPHRTFIPKE